MTIGMWFLMMILTTVGGGIYIGYAVNNFKSGQYTRFGFCVMLVISFVLLMAKTVILEG